MYCITFLYFLSIEASLIGVFNNYGRFFPKMMFLMFLCFPIGGRIGRMEEKEDKC